jgi:hypothetical protein
LIPAASFKQGVKKQNPKGKTARAPDKLRFDPFSAEVPSSAAHAPRREHMLVQIHATRDAVEHHQRACPDGHGTSVSRQ